MSVKKVSFNLDEDIHYKAKEIALKNKTTLTSLYIKWIEEGMKKEIQ